jgi:hypothetical protein
LKKSTTDHPFLRAAHSLNVAKLGDFCAFEMQYFSQTARVGDSKVPDF